MAQLIKYTTNCRDGRLMAQLKESARDGAANKIFNKSSRGARDGAAKRIGDKLSQRAQPKEFATNQRKGRAMAQPRESATNVVARARTMGQHQQTNQEQNNVGAAESVAEAQEAGARLDRPK